MITFPLFLVSLEASVTKGIDVETSSDRQPVIYIGNKKLPVILTPEAQITWRKRDRIQVFSGCIDNGQLHVFTGAPRDWSKILCVIKAKEAVDQHEKVKPILTGIERSFPCENLSKPMSEKICPRCGADIVFLSHPDTGRVYEHTKFEGRILLKGYNEAFDEIHLLTEIPINSYVRIESAGFFGIRFAFWNGKHLALMHQKDLPANEA